MFNKITAFAVSAFLMFAAFCFLSYLGMVGYSLIVAFDYGTSQVVGGGLILLVAYLLVYFAAYAGVKLAMMNYDKEKVDKLQQLLDNIKSED